MKVTFSTVCVLFLLVLSLLLLASNSASPALASPSVQLTSLAPVTNPLPLSGGSLSSGSVNAPSALSTWGRTYGGTSDEQGNSVLPTPDGGYVIAGETSSFGAGDFDAWVVKLDAQGMIQWQKTYGGSREDRANQIALAPDGGYVVVGYTTSFGNGNPDAWAFKLDASGNLGWQKLFPAFISTASAVVAMPGGGYIVVGNAYPDMVGGSGMMVWKLDANGVTTRWFVEGGTRDDGLASVALTPDGGYVVAGYTFSHGAGANDVWVLKYSSSDALEWARTYGGSNADYATSVAPAVNGGYIVAGNTESFGAGGTDAWVLRLDATGNAMWQKTYGESRSEQVYSVQPTADGGYALAGFTQPAGADNPDAWMLKLSGNGSILWQKAYGRMGSEAFKSLATTPDGFIAAGYNTSFAVGGMDAWAFKLDPNGDVSSTCTLEGISSAVSADTTATVTNAPPGAGRFSNVYFLDSNATVTNSNADICTVCEAAGAEPVSIDVKPGSSGNAINRKSKGLLPVAILSTASFDARTVNLSAVRLGPGNASAVRPSQRDVNGDGRPDLLLFFRIPNLGIRAATRQLCLSGTTRSGTAISGCDSIRVVP